MSEEILIQYQIIVTGKVQNVGFRDKIDDLAFDHNILGYVENRPKKEVFILAQGLKENLDQFCQKFQRLEPPVKVQSLRITEHPYDQKYDDFLVVRGDPNEELGERFDTAVYFLHSIDRKQDQMLNKQDQMLGKQDQMINKQDQMLGKQDQMIDKQDQMLGKQDQMIDKQDQMLSLQKESICLQSKTLDEVHALRSDLTDKVMTEVTLARTEIRELRNELIQAGVLNVGHS